MERVLVIGAGLLGSRLIAQASDRHEVHAADSDAALGDVGCPLHRLDITDKKAVVELLTSLRPAAVFNTAALTNVDLCETDPGLALKVNGTAAGYIALACARVNAYLCHVSTDYVFDGKKGRYAETDKVNPRSNYGISKLLGETEVRCLKERWPYIICRSSILYGSYRKRFNFACWALDQLRQGKPLRIVTDQVGSPTLAEDLADALLALWRKQARGVFHVAGREPISRHGFVLKLCEVFGLDRGLVTPVRTEELKQRAPRPADSSLDVSKAEQVLKRSLLDVRQGLERMKAQEDASPGGEAGPSSRTA